MKVSLMKMRASYTRGVLASGFVVIVCLALLSENLAYQLGDLRAVHEKLLLDSEALDKEHRSLQVSLSNIQGNYTALKENYTSLSRNYTDLSQNYVALSRNYSDLQPQIRKFQEVLSAMEKNYTILMDKYSQLNLNYYKLASELFPFQKTLLANQIFSCLSEVASWKDMVNIGVVMHKSALNDFDAWITNRANASDWRGVLAVKRYAEQAGYSSKVIDAKLKLALSNIPMFTNYPLPKTDERDLGYFWPMERYVLYGYRYAEELNWETGRWNKTSGFLALRSVRDRCGRAFYRCNPDILTADSLLGTRWHEAGSLMDSFFIFYKLGVKDALNYAIQEWEWLNSNLWAGDHFNYAVKWPNWEFSGMSVFPNAAKLYMNGTNLKNWDRVIADLQFRYVGSLWGSPQWQGIYKVAEHHHPGNPERRLDGTLDAWIMLDTFYGLFNSGNQRNMKNMLEGNGVTQAWIGLNASDLRQSTRSVFRLTSACDYSNGSTALAALCLFLMGISPRDGRGLAIPLISDKHSCYGSLNYHHFEFDYTNHRIKIPVWGGTTLKFMYGSTPVTKLFEASGIYSVTFTSDWNSISQVTKVSDVYFDECYLWT
jgi:hypothetical protein